MFGVKSKAFITFLGTVLCTQAFAQSDQPIERPELRFPAGAKQSGVCEASFDVKPDGTPDNIRITSCTDNIYEWPSQVAVGKFKYSPKADWRRNQKTKLTFDLENEFGIRMPVPDPVNVRVIPEERAIVDSYFGTKENSRHRQRESEYCCYDYSVSNSGYAFNVVAKKCSSDDAEAIYGTGFDIRSWKFDPAIKDELGISTSGYSDMLWFRKNGRVYLGTEDDVAEFCAP